MLYEKLIADVNEDGISENDRAERLKELQAYVKAQTHLHDDHGSAIIGSRSCAPDYPPDSE